jgi:hypothetical protein
MAAYKINLTETEVDNCMSGNNIAEALYEALSRALAGDTITITVVEDEDEEGEE